MNPKRVIAAALRSVNACDRGDTAAAVADSILFSLDLAGYEIRGKVDDEQQRERLARHLYVEGCALEAEAAARWDAGKVTPGQMGNYRRAANRAIAALVSTEK